MSNRLTDADKWKDVWFANLSPYAKLLFIFLCESCNNAGVYEINKKFILFYTGLSEEQLISAIEEIKKTYIKSRDGNRIWIKNYLKYQKKLPLNSNNNNHKQIIMILKENLQDEKRFKGCAEMQAILPKEIVEKPTRKRNTVINPESQSENENSTLFTGEVPAPIPNKRFQPPTIEEVQMYMKEKDFVVFENEGVRFFNYFQSNGWKVGKNPMKDWKSAVNTWIHNWHERHKIPKKSKMESVKEVHESLEGVDWNKVYSNS